MLATLIFSKEVCNLNLAKCTTFFLSKECFLSLFLLKTYKKLIFSLVYYYYLTFIAYKRFRITVCRNLVKHILNISCLISFLCDGGKWGLVRLKNRFEILQILRNENNFEYTFSVNYSIFKMQFLFWWHFFTSLKRN